MTASSLQTRLLAEPNKHELDKLNACYHQARYPHFRQSPAWFLCQGDDAGYFFAASYLDGRIVAYSLVRERALPLLGKSKYFIERGPVFVDEAVLQQHVRGIVDLLPGRRILWIRMNPYVLDDRRSEIASSLRYLQEFNLGRSAYTETVLLDLSPSQEQLYHNFSPSLRRNIRKSQALGMVTEELDNTADVQSFFSHYNVFAQNKGLEQLTSTVMGRFHSVFIQDDRAALLLQARYEGKVIAGIALMPCGKSMLYEWGFRCNEGGFGSLPISHLLHWHAIKALKERGYSYYDLGGYASSRGKAYPLNRFKRGFSGKVVQTVRETYIGDSPLLVNLVHGVGQLRKIL